MTLFELYELAVNNKLKFTKLRLMEDKNEGLGEILKLQSGMFGFPLRKYQANFREAYEAHREDTYISCWTPVADAMAMWLLYSPNQANFRIRTSTSKLQGVLKQNGRDFFGRASSLTPGTLVPMHHQLAPVRYVHFTELHNRSKAKLEARDQALYEAHLRGAAGEEEFAALLDDQHASQIDELKYQGHLKHEAYTHEDEVRASFRLRIRNTMTLEEFRALPDGPTKVFGDPMLGYATRDNSPSVVNLDTPKDFIDEICFDPRMPFHHRSTIRQMLGREDLTYVESTVFGSIIDEHDLTVKQY